MAGSTAVTQATQVVSLIFFVLRFALIVYLGVNIVRIVGAMREDEDYKSIARTPMLILICLAVADFVSTLVIGA
jgi:hypothetical protein